ncbi:band 4.1-like protein 2 isoform X11 [Danio aesculapii]|uniref:band 4.1-like protein 2 isoform X11 n=1 Tax=Danio aesculapii TaxID=1142201 RepID=UPI0024C04F1F|nr:band 4.1-like protein 2 isoform X11 [Danio aesculapii]
MTTEAGSETDVKKEPEKVPEVEQQQEQETVPPQTEEQSSKPAESEAPPTAAAAAAVDQPQEENQSAEPQSEPEASASPDPSSPPAASAQKKEKGISRFLPPWLKRQKSQSQEKPAESPAPHTEPIEEKSVKEENEEEEKKSGDQPDGGAAERTEEEEEEVKEEAQSRPQEEEQEKEEEEKEKEEEKSVGSADTQPAREEREGEPEVKESEEKKEEKKVQEQVIQPEESAALLPHKLNKKMKMVVCHVTLLDGSQFSCEVEKRAKGQYLFFEVCEHLNLVEKDYFALSFKDNAEQRCWLDPTKEIKRQIRNSQWQFAFSVKFYPPDPSQLTEDLTRYLLCLQLRQDIASGRLPCSFVTHALLGSYALQAELGDQDPDEHRLDYISDFQFAPNQTKELEEKVVELHKSHRGMTPAQADAQFLENAKKLSMYGVDLHHAKDSEGVDIMLGVCANGLLIYKDRLRINRFAWPKILKISYKRSNFYIKIRPGEAEQFESTVGFKLPNHRAAKRVWKVCVEHHTFFRLTSPEQPTKSKFLTLGSKFRYSGRTQAQARQASTLIDRPTPYFQRTSSKRISRSLDGAPMVNISDYSRAVDSAAGGDNGPALELNSDSKSTEVKPEVNGQPEVVEVVEETVVIEEVVKAKPKSPTPEPESAAQDRSLSSDSESEDEAEYHAHTPSISVQLIKEEPEEELNQQAPPPEPITEAEPADPAPSAQTEEDEAPNGHAPIPEAPPAGTSEEEPHIVNGGVSRVETEVICCSEPPVVKTEMVTISDTFAAQKTEISTKEVPIVHTETKTITYEAAQLDGNGDGEPGVLMTAQTITSESLCTTTTTHITKTLKGGLSETRIEKRIVITGDSDIDHDQALAQAIKEAKEQHPDMSVTRVVVHKETELAEEDD